jgi:hypothetical protein
MTPAVFRASSGATPIVNATRLSNTPHPPYHAYKTKTNLCLFELDIAPHWPPVGRHNIDFFLTV